MDSIGLLITGFNCDEHIDEVLKPWTELKNKHNIIFSFVYCQFKEYIDINGKQEIKNPAWLDKHRDSIDYFHLLEPTNEIEARNTALEPLLNDNVDIVIQLDCDEFFTTEGIENIINYVNKDKFIAWYRISYKNYVMDGFLEEEFTPPRVYRTKIGKFKLNKFYDDNNISYLDEEKEISDKVLANRTISKEINWTKHLSWPSSERGRLKCLYQERHFGQCSYKWNNEKNRLEFNKEYYEKTGQKIPKVISE